MLQEQEHRILGYFIEEAKDHLNTIEQGLLNLQNTLEDPETVNEVFRAAHSIKGGAAMLGLDSIQQTSHHLEDYFKVLKEGSQIQIDQKLESLFLAVFDTLKELIEHLEESFSLPEDVVNNLMVKVEPVFKALNQHLELLVNQAGGGVSSAAPQSMQPRESQVSSPQESVSPKSPTSTATLEKTNSLPVFQNQVMQKLREMLQLFKQPETPQTRQQLQECSDQLARLGKQFDLLSWCTLCETASGAIANGKNTYRTLAPIVIKEIKQSQELVLAGRAAEIKTSEQLQALSVRN
jgi:chemotaxis protein histidine kinase CheA